MAISAFDDKAAPPIDADLRSTLGAAYAAWTRLPALIAGRFGPVTDVWKFTSASTGWGMRLLHNGRVIVYMTPQRKQFLVSFSLGEKAVAAARAAKLHASVLEAIEAAPRYAEGRGVRILVRSSRQLAPLAQLAQIKCES
jgi:uncharacterized protein DUF3788